MRISRLILVLAVVAAMAGMARASDPMDIVSSPKANYTYSYGTLAISSTTATSLAGTGGSWRQVSVYQPSSTATVHYKVDSNATVATDGFPFKANVGRFLTTNKIVYFQMAAGESAITLFYELVSR